jgi:hypothetical protein
MTKYFLRCKDGSIRRVLIDSHPSTISRDMEVLLVEDNLGDVELTKLALEESQLSIHLSVVGDGGAALDFLHHQKKIC